MRSEPILLLLQSGEATKAGILHTVLLESFLHFINMYIYIFYKLQKIIILEMRIFLFIFYFNYCFEINFNLYIVAKCVYLS
jgi:hypothetical protein